MYGILSYLDSITLLKKHDRAWLRALPLKSRVQEQEIKRERRGKENTEAEEKSNGGKREKIELNRPYPEP